MILDPDTVCARTAAGEGELARPTHGLALGQRRVLTLLESPRSIANLAAEHRLDVERLDRDLARLAELKLVVLLARQEQPDPGNARATTADAVIIGRSPKAARVVAGIVGVGALGLALFVFFGARERAERSAAAEPVARQAARPAPGPDAAKAPVVLADVRSLPAPEPAAAAVDGTQHDVRAPAGAPAPTDPVGARSLTATLPVLTATPNGLGPLPVAPAPSTRVTPPAPPLLVPTFVSATAGPAPAATTVPPIAAQPATVPAATVVPSPPSTASDVPMRLASVAPSPAIAHSAPAAELRALSRDPPPFPREAKAAGINAGVVKARLALDAQGKVTGVEILAATPPRVFDRAVRSALSHWTFEPGSGVETTDVEVVFKTE
jgi:protein TonB